MEKPEAMKSLLLFTTLCFTLSLTQCKDDDHKPSDACVTNPAKNLPWLKAQITSFKINQTDVSIFQIDYQSTAIFMMMPCCPLCEVIPSYYDCDGNVLENIENESLGDYTLIWSLPDSACG